jgi:glutathione synthase/RimK-type ligase-like ATP-grasp enzyme
MFMANKQHLAPIYIALQQSGDHSVNADAIMKQEAAFVDNELRTLAKRSALAMGSMTDKGREFVRDQFAAIDFYDKDLTEALLKYNLVKGAGKK